MDLDADSARVQYRLNTDRHSFTCWKYNVDTCRMSMPQPSAPVTYVAELDIDPSSTDVLIPMRKFCDSAPGKEIIYPPPAVDLARPIDPEETRILGFGLRRTSKMEQMQVETNKLTSYLNIMLVQSS